MRRIDTSLTRDLTGCIGDGLVIGSHDVTLDLAGHIVAGTNTVGSVGVRIEGGSDALVEHGRVTGFGIGLLLFQTDRSRVSDNRFAHSVDGIALVESDYNDIPHNVASHNAAGVGLFDMSNQNRVTGNTTDFNSDTGILLDRHADDNVIVCNSSTGNAFAGIVIGASTGVDVRGNVASGNPGSGIAVVDAAVGTTVNHNVANHNGAMPLGCQPDCPLLDDGIHVDVPGTIVSRNTAKRNADLDIDAVTGVTDAGRNHARGNGDPRQCSTVTCKP